jgi:PAS domain S-box-containing protein
MQNVEKVLNALEDDISDLETSVIDWAYWDDTYQFITDLNSNYIKSNLTDKTFTEINIHLIAFINTSGSIVYKKSYDVKENREVSFPKSMLPYVNPDGILLRHTHKDGLQGLLLLPQGPLLFASHPVLTSEETGPVRGTLIMGRFLNSEEVDSLSEKTRMSLQIRDFSDKALSEDFMEAKTHLTDKSRIYIKPVSDETVRGYALYDDVFGNPGLIVSAEMKRAVYQHGIASLKYWILSLISVGLIFTIVIFLIIKKLVVSRVTQLNDNVNRLKKSEDLSTFVSIPGNDELTNLSNEIYTMLNVMKQSSEKRFYALFNQADDCILLLTAEPADDPLIVDINKSGCTMHGYTREELIGKPISMLDDPQTAKGIRERVNQINAGKSIKFDGAHVRKDGSTFPVEIIVQPIQIAGKNYIMGIDRDITERKLMEDVLRASLEEKDILMQEVHHRVKNNFQVIISLLHMQERSINDERLSQIFMDSENRIKSMSMVHELLYKSTDMSNIDFNEYVRTLTTFLYRSYKKTPEQITLHLDMDSVTFNIQLAVPLGLIINELVSNSMKHAFPGGTKGKISIILHRDEIEDAFTLTVRDNGAGLKPDIDISDCQSVGLRLVVNIVERQLGGTISYTGDGGSEFTIKAPRYFRHHK